jgi:3-hydroxymyristoyl/3-hydroxydecanoyl-(acyl carrier protein) dehydratase
MNRIEAEFRIAPSHPSLPGHFPGRPVVPGVLLLDEVIGIAEQAAGSCVVGLRDIKFIQALRPDEVARVSCTVEGDRVSFSVRVARDSATRVVASGKLLLRRGN